jgi:group I intron endonuclease
MNSLSFIYCIENTINGKKYIGKHCGKNSEYFGSGVTLKKAIAKYGKESFTKSILEYCEVSRLNEREVYWIAEHNTYLGKGYNLTPGGDGWSQGMKHSTSSIEKIKNTKKGSVVISDKQKQQIRDTLKKYYNTLTSEQRSETYGVGGRSQKGVKKRPFTEEHCKSLSKGQTGKQKNQSKEHRAKIGLTRRKKVGMYKLDSELVCIFDSMTEASKAISASISEISKSCKDQKTTAKGYLFKKLEIK